MCEILGLILTLSPKEYIENINSLNILITPFIIVIIIITINTPGRKTLFCCLDWALVGILNLDSC